MFPESDLDKLTESLQQRSEFVITEGVKIVLQMALQIAKTGNHSAQEMY